MPAGKTQHGGLPLRLATEEDDVIYGSDVGGGSEDWIFDDGTVCAVCTIEFNALAIHIFGVHDRSLEGARTGVGRRALTALRNHSDATYNAIYANGVEEGTAAEAFWSAMKAEGLIDGYALVGQEWIPEDRLPAMSLA